MAFIKLSTEVTALFRETAGITLLDVQLYHYLAEFCHSSTGIVHEYRSEGGDRIALSVSQAARDLGYSRRRVQLSLKKLRELGLLVGGSGLSGRVAHMKPYKRHREASVSKRDAVRNKRRVDGLVETVTESLPFSGGSAPSSNGSGSQSSLR